MAQLFKIRHGKPAEILRILEMFLKFFKKRGPRKQAKIQRKKRGIGAEFF
jgi:hypothetical protein